MKKDVVFFDLSSYASSLFAENAFLNAFSRYFEKRSDNSMPTFAAVTYDAARKSYIIYYNSAKLLFAKEKMHKDKFDMFVRDLITHEMLHPAVGHFKECRPLVLLAKQWREEFETATAANKLRISAKLRKVNISFDLSINHYLREGLKQDIPVKNPDGSIDTFKGCFPEDYNLPEGMTSQWYYENIVDNFAEEMNKLANQIEDMENSESLRKKVDELLRRAMRDIFDEHSGMSTESNGTNPCNGTIGDCGPDTSENPTNDPQDSSWADIVLKEAVSQSVRAAMRSPHKRFGNMPFSLVKELERVAGMSQIDWKSYFNYFCRGRARGDKKKRISIKNKRYDMFAGSVRVRRPKIAVAYDQSGSVSDNMLQELDKQIQSLSSLVDFTIIPFDCTVDTENIQDYKKGHKYKLDRTRNGGTNFDAPTDWVNKHRRKFDGLIIATDLCAEQPGPSNVPRLWLTLEGCETYGEWNLSEPIIKISQQG